MQLIYTNHGEIKVTVKNQTRYFILQFQNIGIGIDIKEQESIFDEFKQVPQEYEYGNIEGSGLGLAITKG